MAEAVGSTGNVDAIDSSEPMLGLARKRCADMPRVNFSAGQATDLQLPDANYDVAVSVQVYEYIADVDRALAEMYRVLRPGGRAAIVSSDWASMAWEATDKKLKDKVLSAFEEHCAYVDLPRQLGPKLARAGFKIEAQTVIVQFNPKYDPDTYSVQLIPIVGSFIVGRRGVTQEDAEAWMADLRQMGDKGEYFFCLNQFLYLVTKPA
jgi:ubiquinone/menaquinone biosynthesis C-methylase UbiE